MAIAIKPHLEFERSLIEAFPPSSRPSIESMPVDSSLARTAKRLFEGATWPEVVGHRLTYGEMDIFLSIWMEHFPAEIFDYYIASHLMFASFLLGYSPEANYVMSVSDAFLLPPAPESEISLAEVDYELAPYADVESNASTRLEFYRRITPAKRACIGQFLDLYLSYNKERFTERAVRAFEQNRDYWLYSSR